MKWAIIIIMRSAGKQKNRDARVRVKKMEYWIKLVFTLFTGLVCLAVTKGDPKRSNALRNIQITDQKLQYILETTIAQHTKTIEKRITEVNNGYWKILDSVTSPKWAVIEVELKTRIGIRLNSITYDKAYNNVHIDFGAPCVLDRSYTTKLLSTSDSFYSKWSVESFEGHKEEFLSELVESESNNLIDIFKNDPKKLRDLEGQYYTKILASLNDRYYELDPEVMVWKLNQYILGVVGQMLPYHVLPSINTSTFYTKQVAASAYKNAPAIHQPQTNRGKPAYAPTPINSNQKQNQKNRPRLNEKQQAKRDRIKNRLFNKE